MRLFVSIVVLGISAIVALNSVVDVAGLATFGRVTELAEHQGPDDLLVWENLFDQRAWVKAKIDGGCPEVLILGSSTVGALAHDMFPGHRMLNGWLSAPTVEDFEALTTVLEHADCAPRTIVVGVDPWLLNAAFTDQRWQSLYDDYVEYHHATGKLRAFGSKLRRGWSVFKERLNFTTTKLAVERLWRGARGEEQASAPRLVAMAPGAFCTTISVAHYIRANDGHFVSCPAFIPSQKEIEDIARGYIVNNGHEIRRWKEVDQTRLRRLEQVTRRWHDHGSRIVFVAPPYHPLTYTAMRADGVIAANLDALDAALGKLDYARFVNLRDPNGVGCAPVEFEDSHHGAPSCVAKVAARLAPAL